MKKITLYTLISLLALNVFSANKIPFKVSGLQSNEKAIVSFGSDSYLDTQIITSDGEYSFSVSNAGKYFIKIEAQGYNIPQAQTVIVEENGQVLPATTIGLAITKMSDNPNEWTHSWQEDVSTSGYTTTAYINNPPTIDFLGKKIVPADVPSVGILNREHKIVLSDEEETWSQEYSYRLLETLKTIPYHIESALPAKFTLTNDHLYEDIEITDLGNGKEVRISADAFYYANPFLVSLDGVRGRFFSKRLHHALINYVTDFGNNEWQVNLILERRFGCTTNVPSYEELTKGITDEDAGRFQKFFPSELVSIINMFEELPEGFHKTPHLNYLVRRVNGHPHPIYPEAAAVAWCVDNGYIEFMEKAFGGDNNTFDTLRLILHEKSHFLWAFSFSDEIKNDWIELGGWYKDPNSSSGWSTTKTTEFVSAYAHAVNPNEDMAESIAHYLKNPELLQSRSLPKYEFIRDRIMHGTRYISKIPDHLTFEVLNLNPDYDYPGKIKRLDVKVEGAPDEDKTVTVEIELNHIDGFEDGASCAYTRITSPTFIDADGNEASQFYDMSLFPVDGNPHLLRGSFVINKYSKTGYWTAGDIGVTDIQGNARFEGRNDYVWNMYVNNPLEDTEKPKYVSGSLNYELSNTTIEGRDAQMLSVTFKATDNIGILEGAIGLRLQRGEGVYSFADFGGTYNPETQTATIDIIITEYFQTADYHVNFIGVTDKAGNALNVRFSDSPLDEPVKKIFISTTNPDSQAPEVDLSRLSVYAEPTNKEAPDGETLVTINYFARDDKSGLGLVSYQLLDPQGIRHHQYHYHDNCASRYFNGDPTVWTKYTIKCVLPKGSAPGIWGLADISVSDKAWNGRTYNFVETLIFEPDDSNTDYVLFTELGDDNILTLQVTSDVVSGYGFNYRIIHEGTGEEITGKLGEQTRSASTEQFMQIDVSGMDDGELVVIIQITDDTGEIIGVRSARVIKDTRTGIQEVKNKLSIYPNPVENDIHINGISAGEYVRIYSVDGLLVNETLITGDSQTISVSNLPKGMYYLNVKSETMKFIKK